jgi:hypothetical protein
MKFPQVDGEFPSAGRSHVALGVYSQVWVITFVGEERQNACRVIRSVVVCEFCEREESGPIILLEIAENA